ncbi:dTDP-4-dehydrorhamnose 3,5-epimerase [Chloroflexi bacterium TSY]|nr:dTDP-4-dehydrorhamnose 3,5-epimerase [Chloroflexi bacterium TSY]
MKYVKLQPFGDDRGRFMETFRKEWFPERSWDIIQTNRSDSTKGVLRGLHYHHKQVDYWTVIRGTLRVGLADLRKDSNTYQAVETIDVGDDNLMGVFIPIGVAHGFLGLTDATLMYIVDNYYDGDDEFGVAWNDPDLAIDWGIDNPILSGRDQKNPYLKEILT